VLEIRRRHNCPVRRALVVILSAAGVAACGVQAPVRSQPPPHTPAPRQASTPALPTAHPQAVEPVAGVVASSSPSGAAASPAPAATPSPSTGNLAQPTSDAQIRQELAQTGMSANANQATLTPDGLAIPPVNAPPAVQEIIQAGNEIAHLPYVWGGGHVTYADTGYDCSGSISYVFEAAGLLSSPVVSGDLMNWGAAGPGKWITVFANAGHTFMYVAGLRFDTVALAETGSRWSNRSADESDLHSFAVRHPPGL
jgi:cell wall-associated NlpC family hydrolase